MSKSSSVLLCLLLCVFASGNCTQTIIFIYGTSCAGKSTLSKALTTALGSGWKRIDRDDVIERQQSLLKEPSRQELDDIDQHADDYLLDEIAFNECHLVIDTQSHNDILQRLSQYRILSVLVYAPLDVLIERDDTRTATLHRSKQRQYYARAYILETFSQLFDIEEHHSDRCCDCVDSEGFSSDLLDFCSNESTEHFFMRAMGRSDKVHLLPKEPCDLVVNSCVESVDGAIARILGLLQTP